VAEPVSCQVIYDAGSSGTRLYVYQQTATGWVKHSGPRTSALADPVRGIRGKTPGDAPAVVAEMVTALEAMRSGDLTSEGGVPRWSAFDWQKECRVEAAAVYATAGMRLAEQQDAEASTRLWSMLNNKLSERLGLDVTTRTLTGYEEGLFAWLAVREGQPDANFVVAEMGGASVQITFPCPECEEARVVTVRGSSLPMASYSFLGWGQDEAWKRFGPLDACARGAGELDPNWLVSDCAVPIRVSSETSEAIRAYLGDRDELRWYLRGAFTYMRESDVERFCREGVDSSFEPETSCFRAVYLRNVLAALGVPGAAQKGRLDWTLGAAVCTATRCLGSRVKELRPLL